MAADLGDLGDGAAVGDGELGLDEVESGDLLGDGVLDLEARVDLEEVEVALVGEHELTGAQADVSGVVEQGLGPLSQGLDGALGHEGGRGLLDDLLVAALHGAVAGGDDGEVAVDVTHALGLDVATRGDELLDEELAEVTAGHGVSGGEVLHVLLVTHDLDAASATSVGALEDDREAVLGDEGVHLGHVGDRVDGAGHRLDTGGDGDAAGADLVTELADGVGGRAEPGQAGVRDGLGGLGDLGEEAVAGVDRVGTGALGDVDDLVDVEVGLLEGGALQCVGLVGQDDGRGFDVLVGVHGHGVQAEVTGGPDDTGGNFAAVRHEDAGRHRAPFGETSDRYGSSARDRFPRERGHTVCLPSGTPGESYLCHNENHPRDSPPPDPGIPADGRRCSSRERISPENGITTTQPGYPPPR